MGQVHLVCWSSYRSSVCRFCCSDFQPNIPSAVCQPKHFRNKHPKDALGISKSMNCIYKHHMLFGVSLVLWWCSALNWSQTEINSKLKSKILTTNISAHSWFQICLQHAKWSLNIFLFDFQAFFLGNCKMQTSLSEPHSESLRHKCNLLLFF